MVSFLCVWNPLGKPPPPKKKKYAGPLRLGGGCKGPALKKKITFLKTFFCIKKKVPTAIRLEGGGGISKTLMALPLRNDLFFIFAASLTFTSMF